MPKRSHYRSVSVQAQFKDELNGIKGVAFFISCVNCLYSIDSGTHRKIVDMQICEHGMISFGLPHQRFAALNITGSNAKSFEEFVYIGLRMNPTTKTYAWTDGTAYDYKKWAENQPDHPEDEHCCQVRY